MCYQAVSGAGHGTKVQVLAAPVSMPVATQYTPSGAVLSE